MDLQSDNIWVFFGAVVFISLSGVMTPGPVFAAAIAKGYHDRSAGVKIALGHGMIEFPLIFLIVVSLGYVFQNSAVMLAIGFVGGILLVYLGASMIKSRKRIPEEGKGHLPYGSVVTGALTTSANPYFFLWWATVGALLVYNAQYFGPLVVVVFAVVHWSCDLGWYTLTSYAVFRTKHLWTPRIHEIVFGVCGALMVAFGIYFVAGPVSQILS